MSSVAFQPDRAVRTSFLTRRSTIPLVVLGFTIFYFTYVILFASEKYFWYDEIVTVYVSRLPGLHAIWQGLRAGIDLNPPLFYIITRASEAVFGEGLIGTRVPEIIGFYVFCLCLFRFVYRRAGLLCGIIALLFPTVTSALYYATEARPYGIILGFFGLALVSWQAYFENPQHRWWLPAFGLCLLGVFLLHCFALLIVLPFVFAEVSRSILFKRVNWRIWTVLAVCCLLAVSSYVPMLFSFWGTHAAASSFSMRVPPNWTWRALPSFYVFLLGPCVIPIVAALVLLIAEKTTAAEALDLSISERKRLLPELVLAASSLLLPIFAVILGILAKAPLFPRYSIAAVAGLGILVAMATGFRVRSRSMTIALIVIVAALSFKHFAGLVYHRLHGWNEDPRTLYNMNYSVEGPLGRFYLLHRLDDNTQPIAVLSDFDFLYLLNYAPQLASRLYYVAVRPDDFFYNTLPAAQRWFPVHWNPVTTPAEMLRLHPHFYIYGVEEYGTQQAEQLSAFLKYGANIKHLRSWDKHYLADMEVNHASASAK